MNDQENKFDENELGIASEASHLSDLSGETFTNISLTDEILAGTAPCPQRRPMVYVNFMHTWFHDPKNWNDAESLFQ